MPLDYTYNADFDDPKDAIRFQIGDTDMTVGAPLFADQEIAVQYTLAGSTIGASVALCKALIARFSRAVDASEGNASASMSQLATHYRQLLADLQRDQMAAVSPAGAFTASGAVSRLDPAFTRRMGDPSWNVPTPESDL